MLRGRLEPGTQGLGDTALRKGRRRLFRHCLRQTQSVCAKPADPVFIVMSEIARCVSIHRRPTGVRGNATEAL